MEYREILQKRVFVVAGDTINPEKYAYRIKEALLENNYEVYSVGKELDSILEVPTAFDILDLCINPIKGLALVKEAKDKIPFVLIQPGAESDELENYLRENDIPFRRGCILRALAERDSL